MILLLYYIAYYVITYDIHGVIVLVGSLFACLVVFYMRFWAFHISLIILICASLVVLYGCVMRLSLRSSCACLMENVCNTHMYMV